MKRTFLTSILGLLLSAGLAAAQSYSFVDPSLPEDQNIYVEPAVPHHLSDWITFADQRFSPAPGMILNPSPPIGTEVFFRAGPSAPFGSGVFAQTLDVGWMFEGGVRALLYNETMTGAWVIEGSISNTYNTANSSSPNFPTTISILESGVRTAQVVTIRDLNQTFGNVGAGYDWYLWHPLGSNRSLSFGFDLGARWGSGRAQFNEIGYRNGELYGGYGAIHADLLIPVGGCFTFVCGVRGEYDLMQNTNILQTTQTLQDASLLFNVGLRF